MFLTPHCFIVNDFIILYVVFIYWLAGAENELSPHFSSLLISPNNNNNNNYDNKVDTVL